MSQRLGYVLSASVLTALFISGCSSVTTQSTESAASTPVNMPLTSNQSYFGVLPCANCPGIETQLDLLANGTYFLTETYQDRKDGRYSRMGLWSIDDNRLILQQTGDDHLVYFADESGGWLQADTLGRPIVSQLNYTLEPTGWQPAEISTEIDGMLTYMADAPSLVECSTGLRFPVVMTPEWLDVERRYLESSKVGGDYLHTRANVVLNWETPEEGAARHHLRFQEFKEMHPAMTCGSPITELEHFEWDLIELDGFYSSDLEAMHTRPHVRFSGQQLSGHSGCNVMAGDVQLEGDHISFGPIASTRMFCADAAEVEMRFLQLTEEAVYSSLEGQQWVWYDEDMKRLAAFVRKPVEE